MRAGKLRHRITLQSRQTGEDAYGAPTEQWVNDQTVWAQIEPLRGQEAFSAQQEYSAVTYRIRMRYRQIDHGQRLRHGVDIYDIQYTEPPNDRSMLTIIATAGATDG